MAPSVVSGAAGWMSGMSAAPDGIVPDTKRGSRSNGDAFTVETLGTHHLHDVVHHLHDVGAV